jgi:hypothetical protein
MSAPLSLSGLAVASASTSAGAVNDTCMSTPSVSNAWMDSAECAGECAGRNQRIDGRAGALSTAGGVERAGRVERVDERAGCAERIDERAGAADAA